MDMEYSEKVKHLRANFQLCRNTKRTAQMIPKTWTKYGEIYRNIDQSKYIYVCYICMEYVEHFANIYTTDNVSDFWNHLQRQHMLTNSEMPPETLLPDVELEKTIESVSQHIKDITKGNMNENEKINSLPRMEKISENVEKCIEKEKKKLEENILNNNDDSNIEGETLKANSSKGNEASHENDDDNNDNDDGDDDDVDDTINVSTDDENDDAEPLIPTAKECMAENNTYEISDEEEEDEIDEISNTTLTKGAEAEEETTLDEIKNYQENQEKSIIDNNTNFVKFTQANSSTQLSENNNINYDSLSIATRQYECNYCPQKFPHVWQLDRHQRTHLSNYESQRKFRVRPFQCNVCGKRTITEKAMTVHQRRFHSLESDSETTRCHICQKLVLTTNIQQHMLVHTQIRLRCNLCNRSYKQKQTLRLHVKKFHPNALNTDAFVMQNPAMVSLHMTPMNSSTLLSGQNSSVPLSMTPLSTNLNLRRESGMEIDFSTNSSNYGSFSCYSNYQGSNCGYTTCLPSSMYSYSNRNEQSQIQTPSSDSYANETIEVSPSNSQDQIQIISYGSIVPNDAMEIGDEFLSGKRSQSNAISLEISEKISSNEADHKTI
uniref:C2H2-type domain-containing protein n=1 Tax=Glossina brevipalpis TaxID=37001 RepID=A0A1A9X3J0_9MUSC